MIRLEDSGLVDEDVYYACVDGVSALELKQRYVLTFPALSEAYQQYRDLGVQGLLCQLPCLPHGASDDGHAIGRVTKGELNALYSAHMVRPNKPARRYYDQLIVVGGRRCPSCGGIGEVHTLDHYLPKTRYPSFSVFPINLVPSCRDCNTGKGAAVARLPEDQGLHPFLDQGHFFDEQWLFAEVVWTEPISIRYFTAPPPHWSQTDRARVQSHFDNYNLARRFSVDVGGRLTEILSQRALLLEHIGPELYRLHLMDALRTYDGQVNDRRRVMYQALVNAERFWNPAI